MAVIVKSIGPDEIIEKLNKAVAAAIRRHGESEELREVCHAAAAARLLLGAGGQTGGQNRAHTPDSLPR